MNVINFEGLGLSFDINNVLIDIFGIKIYWYSFLIVIGIVISLLLCKKDDGKYNIKFDNILLLFLFQFHFLFDKPLMIFIELTTFTHR